MVISRETLFWTRYHLHVFLDFAIIYCVSMISLSLNSHQHLFVASKLQCLFIFTSYMDYFHSCFFVKGIGWFCHCFIFNLDHLGNPLILYGVLMLKK
jgi:hypothetical protein